MMRRVPSAPVVLILLALGACITGSDRFPTIPWAADIGYRDRVLVMTLVQEDAELTGTGFLARLDSPASESLVLNGTRMADTVSIAFQRQGTESFRFTGWYVSNGTVIRGVLNGAEFSGVNVSFKRR